jgi:membrane-associated phospholipid phosphatase
MFSRDGNQEGKPGFPSGHVTTSVTFFTAIALLFPKYRDISIICGIIYSLLMARSRINKKCHTVLQTIAGGVLGVSAPVIIHNLVYNE